MTIQLWEDVEYRFLRRLLTHYNLYNPWVFNSIQDEEFAPVNGVLHNTTDNDLRETIDEVSDPAEDGCADQGDGTPGACPLSQTVDERSEKDGPAPEAIVAGKACGRLFAVTSSEKAGSALFYAIFYRYYIPYLAQNISFNSCIGKLKCRTCMQTGSVRRS